MDARPSPRPAADGSHVRRAGGGARTDGPQPPRQPLRQGGRRHRPVGSLGPLPGRLRRQPRRRSRARRVDPDTREHRVLSAGGDGAPGRRVLEPGRPHAQVQDRRAGDRRRRPPAGRPGAVGARAGLHHRRQRRPRDGRRGRQGDRGPAPLRPRPRGATHAEGSHRTDGPGTSPRAGTDPGRRGDLHAGTPGRGARARRVRHPIDLSGQERRLLPLAGDGPQGAGRGEVLRDRLEPRDRPGPGGDGVPGVEPIGLPGGSPRLRPDGGVVLRVILGDSADRLSRRAGEGPDRSRIRSRAAPSEDQP